MFGRKIRIGLIVLSLIVLAGCQEQTENYYTGTVENDRYTATTSLSGELIEILAQEGQPVEAGQVLAKIDTKALEIEKSRLTAVQTGAEANLEQVLKGAREEEINKIRQQIVQQNNQITLLQDQLNYTFDNYESTKALFESGAVSEQDLEDVKLAKDNAISKRDQAKAQKNLLIESLNLALKGATEEEVLAAQSQLEQAKWAVAAVEESIEKSEIKAGHNGVIETLYFNKGEQYTAGAKLVDIADIENTEVKIFVEEKNLHKIKVGDQVQIKVDYDPNAKIMGLVDYISTEGEFTPKNLESKENRQEVVYETHIQIVNTDGNLKAGMLVDVYLNTGDDVND